MSIFSKKIVPIAKESRNKIALPSRVVSTNDIGLNRPVYIREVVPGDKWTINLNSYTMLSALVSPTFANIQQVNRAFYVRMVDIWRPFKAFKSGEQYPNDQGSLTDWQEVPHVLNNKLNEYIFTNTNFATSGAETNTSYKIGDTFYTLTTNGNLLVKTLRALGYNLSCNSNDNSSLSLLPMLAYLKVWYDYYYPSRYKHNSPYQALFSTNNFTENGIKTLLSAILDASHFYEDNNYFTSSWVNPNYQESVLDKPMIPVVTGNQTLSYNQTVSVGTASTGAGAQLSQGSTASTLSNITKISQQGLNMLQSLYNYVMRKQLVGYQYYEQILAQFGIRIPQHDDGRCKLLSSSMSRTRIDKVYCTNQQSGQAVLGEYAGKGDNSSSLTNVRFEADDYGYVIIVSSLYSDMGYVQGRSRELRHINRLDFYTPEFDFVGMQPITKDELFADVYKEGFSGSSYTQAIFGYVPRYMEYRQPIDRLLGDFGLPGLRDTLSAFHGFYLFSQNSKTNEQETSNNSRFRDSRYKSQQLNRIFNYIGNDYDHYICVFDIDAKVYRKMRSVTDMLDIDGEGSVTVNSSNNIH